MRQIDADALVREICRDQCERKYEDCDGMCQMVAYVENAPTIGGWNSVKDHSPVKNEDVIIYGKYIGSSGAEYPVMLITDIGEFVRIGYVPIAWMPIPQPPEPPKEENNG